MTTTSHRSATTTAFRRADELYRDATADGSNFWFLGNALHAALRALVASGASDATGLLPYGLTAYRTVVDRGIDGIWRDDFGWWGAAFCTAIRNRTPLGYAGDEHDRLFAELRDQAVVCWKMLDANWRDTDYSAEEDHAVEGADIAGGAFNVAPTGSPSPSLAGRNSVTNAGFWMLSLELQLITGEAAFAARADALSNWVDAWMARGEAGLCDSRGLVLERPTGNALVPAWTWSGDQGAMAIATLRQLEHRMPPPYSDSFAAKLVTAVRDHLSVDGILTEELAFREEFDEFTVDYATGKGICMRHLADVCAVLGTEWTDREFGDFITRNAASVWERRNRTTGELPFAWGTVQPSTPITGHDDLRALVFHVSALDALSAAARFWPDAPIDATADIVG